MYVIPVFLSQAELCGTAWLQTVYLLVTDPSNPKSEQNYVTRTETQSKQAFVLSPLEIVHASAGVSWLQ